jgi:hypothetical protein
MDYWEFPDWVCGAIYTFIAIAWLAVLYKVCTSEVTKLWEV